MVVSGNTGTASAGEFFRLLLHREWNRRHNLPKPKPKDWQTAFRTKGMKLAALCICILTSGILRAAPITECDAVRAIVGEAAGQPYIVKIGVAEAIHNRGTLKGVYGLNAAHNRTEPAWVWRDARVAWAESKRTNITHGATHFGNRSDVAKGTFAGLKFICVLGAGKDATYFFKV
jgi:hypothetical protein